MPGPLDDPLGRLALERGLLTRSQLAAALKLQDADDAHPPLGVVLVQAGLLVQAQVEDLLRTQASAATVPAAASCADPGARAHPGVDPPGTPTSATFTPPTDSTAATDAAAGSPPAPPSPSDPTLSPTVVKCPDAAPTTSFPPSDPRAARRIGKYELEAELGRGGMGVVYKAWHPGLKSYFAVKLLLAGRDASTEDVRRFEREAQAAARLKHPAILAVHDIGVAEGKAWFAMDYVEGASLDKVARNPVQYGLAPGRGGGLNTATALRMTQEIAEALHAAHEAGVVHRDLKPANVLREACSGRLKVMDFGLAKLVDPAAAGASGATATGTLMGTPAYMSPEQAAGDVRRIDARSDVYQIGTILYELLTGRPPYQGATVMDVALQVLNVDPVPPRRLDPTIDRDAETICLTAMAREQGKRYATARALAEDCARKLNDEPIRARPGGWWERPLRWARRRKALAAVGASALLALIGAGVVGLYARSVGREKERERAGREAAEQAKEALREEVLEKLRREAGLYVDATLRLRRKGLRAAELGDYLAPMKASVQEAMAKLPDAPEPHHSMGRMYRALMDFKPAKAEQDKALAKQGDYAPSRYERAVLLALEYRARMRRVRDDWLAAEGQRLGVAGTLGKGGGGGAGLRPMPPDDELAGRDSEALALKAAVVADLEVLVGVVGTGPDGSGATGARAGRRSWSLACARGLRLAYVSGRAADREQARALLNEALAADPTLVEAHEGLAALASAADRPEDAIAAYTAGLNADQGYVPFWIGRGQARLGLGTGLVGRGQDPGPAYAEALADFDRALDLDPASVEAWMYRGGVRMNWGNFKMSRGDDPGTSWAGAVADYGKALDLDPALRRAWMCRGMVRANWGHYRMGRGVDPETFFAGAVADCGKALELDPASAETWMYRGTVRAGWGNYRYGRGQDPGPAYVEAISDYGKALELNPAYADAWMYRGSVRSGWGLFKASRGEDAGPTYAEAIADDDKALELDPARADAWMCRGSARLNWGLFKASRGEDPGPTYAEAVADLDRAVGLNAASADAWRCRGRVQASWGLFKKGRGEDPGPKYAEAVADYGKALELNPASAEAWSRRGMVRANQGVLRKSRGEDPMPAYLEAVADYDKALELNPASAETWRGRGSVRANLGNDQQGRGEDPGPTYAEAVADYGKALELNPALVDAWIDRGAVRTAWGLSLARRGVDPGPLFDGARADLDRAVALRPVSTEAHWRRGLLFCSQGRWAEAVADFETAIRLAPSSEANFRAPLATARARLAGAPAARPLPSWQRTLQEAEQAVRSGDYVTASRAFAEGLQAFAALPAAEGERLRADPAARATLVNAHYNLACVLSLQSAGKAGPGAALVPPVTPADAARLRDAAFDHLRQAIDLGWTDRAHLEADSDLEPLRTDPRWRQLLGSIK